MVNDCSKLALQTAVVQTLSEIEPVPEIAYNDTYIENPSKIVVKNQNVTCSHKDPY